MNQKLLRLNSLFSLQSKIRKHSLRIAAVLSLLAFVSVLSLSISAQTSNANYFDWVGNTISSSTKSSTLNNSVANSLTKNSLIGGQATTIVVTPNNTQGWGTASTTAGGSVNFVFDSAAPAGFGALQLTTDGSNTARAQYFHAAEPNTTLASVTDLSYYTKQVSGPANADPAYQFTLCLEGVNTSTGGCNALAAGGSGFTTIVYEPYQQAAPITPGVYQFQDVDAGQLYSTQTRVCSNGTINGGPGGAGGLYTLAAIKAACPAAVVTAFGLNIGTFNPNYVVNTDLFNFNGTVYDFEPLSTTRAVDDDGMANATDCDAADTASTTIQGAITAANPGDTIRVCPGTYPETIVVDKQLTILGAQAGNLAKPRTNLATESTIVVGLSQTVPVDIQADNVTFDGFNFDINETFPTTNSSDKPGVIIRATGNPGGDGNQNIRILNNRLPYSEAEVDTPFLDRNGIFVAQSTNLLIEGNYLAGFPGQAVIVESGSTNFVYRNNDTFNNTRSSVSTQGNFTRPAPQLKHFNVLIENNRFDRDDAVLFQIEGGIIRNNTFIGGQLGAGQVYLGGGNNNVDITNNSFALSRLQGIVSFDPGFGYGPNSNIDVIGNTFNRLISPAPNGPNSATTGSFAAIDYRGTGGTNTISNNTLKLFGTLPAGGNSSFGIRLRGSGSGNFEITGNNFDGGNVAATGTALPVAGINIISNTTGTTADTGVFPSTSIVNITCNTFTRFQDGISVFDAVAGSFGGLAAGSDINVNNNNIVRNTNFGINNGSTAGASETINAENNYWGAPDGPGPVGPGSGDRVTLNVDYDPFLTAPADCAPTPLAPTAAGATISGRVITDAGRGVSNAQVMLTNNQGQVREVRSNIFGHFKFADVQAGETYTIFARSKQYKFLPKAVSVTQDLYDMDLIASPIQR